MDLTARKTLKDAFDAAASADTAYKPVFERLNKSFSDLMAKTESYEQEQTAFRGLKMTAASVAFSYYFAMAAQKVIRDDKSFQQYQNLSAQLKQHYEQAF